jgi:asparagine synthase (glutamine-hydrolysing)
MLSDKLGGFNTMQLEDEALYDSLLKATYFQDEPIMHLNEPIFSPYLNWQKNKKKVKSESPQVLL